MRTRSHVATFALLPLLAACQSGPAIDAPPGPGIAAVSTSDPLATSVGLDVLAAGGNAADAAVAIGFALAVVHPSAGNLGGGGFALTFRPGESTALALDFRETAPADASRDSALCPVTRRWACTRSVLGDCFPIGGRCGSSGIICGPASSGAFPPAIRSTTST